jgi:hypothetical protein
MLPKDERRDATHDFAAFTVGKVRRGEGSLINWASYVRVMTYPSEHESWDNRAMMSACAAANGVAATVRVAAALALSGRQLDLAGLDVEIGKLCAGVLDLPPDQSRAVQSRLIDLLAELDRLAAAIVPPGAFPTPERPS